MCAPLPPELQDTCLPLGTVIDFVQVGLGGYHGQDPDGVLCVLLDACRLSSGLVDHASSTIGIR